MKAKVSWLVLAASLAVVAACSSEKKEEEQAAPAQTFNDVMKNKVDVRADVVWAIGNAAIANDATLDPAKMTDEDWKKLEAGALSLQEAILEIKNMDPIVVVRPGQKIADEGVPYGDKASDVQAAIDKDPEKLRDFADALAVHTGDLAKAAREHDFKRAGLLIGELDGVCENCHLEFWYPSQKELLKQYGIER